MKFPINRLRGDAYYIFATEAGVFFGYFYNVPSPTSTIEDLQNWSELWYANMISLTNPALLPVTIAIKDIIDLYSINDLEAMILEERGLSEEEKNWLKSNPLHFNFSKLLTDLTQCHKDCTINVTGIKEILLQIYTENLAAADLIPESSPE